MPKKYVVKLKSDERKQLHKLVRNGTGSAKTLTRARILLKADGTPGQPGWTDEAIHDALDISVATIERVRQTYVCHGLDAALKRRARSKERTRRLDGQQEAHLIALACSDPPTGHERWTLRLLADRMVKLEHVEELSHETVRRTLKKLNHYRLKGGRLRSGGLNRRLKALLLKAGGFNHFRLRRLKTSWK